MSFYKDLLSKIMVRKDRFLEVVNSLEPDLGIVPVAALYDTFLILCKFHVNGRRCIICPMGLMAL